MNKAVSYTGKVVLVTGASSGIGRAAALAFGREGAKGVVASRRIEEGEETARQIREAGGEALFVQADVSQADQVERLINKILETYGHLDAAFNNAGVEGKFAPLNELDESVWQQTMDINLKGAWLSLKYEIPAILKNGGGAIAFNSSVVGLIGLGGTTIYGASKAGL